MAPSILIKETFSAAPKAFGVAAHASQTARHVNVVFIPIFDANYHFRERSLLSRNRGQKSEDGDRQSVTQIRGTEAAPTFAMRASSRRAKNPELAVVHFVAEQFLDFF